MLGFGIRQYIECDPRRSLKFMMDKLEHFIEALVEWVLHGNSPRPSSCETSAVKAFSSLLAQVDR